MGKLEAKWKLLRQLSLFRTIRFNLNYFPFRQAICFPVYISRKVCLRKLSGSLALNGPVCKGMVRIGFETAGIFDYRFSRTIWEVTGTVVFEGNAELGQGSRICVGPDGKLIFGDRFSITAESTIIAYSRVQFGKDCLLAWDVMVMDTDFHEIRNAKNELTNAPKPVLIGAHVWIGCRTLILKGATIPDNCVIGANTSVNNTLEKAASVYAGNPAQVIKEGITWKK
ncbi:MAG: acyltransferase [Bacteroidota bacterium]|nr:acyltransferase [Bacteroidota bacterium]